MRTIVYIDAFNLYYGACRAPGRRWLNPSALAQRLLPNDEITGVAYFTANIKRDAEDPGAQDRQRLYHRALRTISNDGDLKMPIRVVRESVAALDRRSVY